MAGRGLSAAMLAELDALQNRPGHLFEAYFDDETARATDFYSSVLWVGNTYVANGHFLGYDGLEETLEQDVPQVKVVLSGVDQAWIAKVLQKKFLNRRLVIRKAMMDAAWNVVIDPSVHFDGLMKRPYIQEDVDGSGKCNVLINASHDVSDIDRKPGRHTNDQEQQFYFPGDRIFEFVDQVNRQLMWGGSGGAGAGPSNPEGYGGTVEP